MMGTLRATLTQLLLCASVLIQLGHAQDCNPADSIWTNIQPQPVGSLTWQTCYGTRQCARLQVPLDYSKPNGTQAVVALLKVPATVPTNSTDYRGPILFNPGGPGNSGVDTINANGDRIQALFGQEYDIIGFDPRGVGHTTPAAEVFPSLPEELIWQLQQSDGPPPFASADAIARVYDNSQIYADLVATRGQGFAPYVSTATVARDMFEIVRAHGRDKLQYWGLSNGSLLGMTFAAMFPDSVERIIADGVVDADDWLSGAFAKSLVKTDAGLNAFYQACVDAGPSQCAIHEATSEKISARVDAIFAQLKRRPIPVFANESAGTGSYGLLTYKMVHQAVFNFLYSPYLGPPNATVAAFALRALEQGDGSAFWQFSVPSRQVITCNGTEFPVPPISAPGQAEIANICADIDPSDGTVEELEAYYESQKKISQFADVWTIATLCKGWTVKPAERFRGPFVANTSFPILFVGNVNDTVLPVQNAIKMSKGFAGSVVLTQDSAGHCSIAANSVCTSLAMRNYMRDGTLPAPGTVCPIESKFFADAPANSTGLASRDSGEAGVTQSWRDLVSKFARVEVWPGHLSSIERPSMRRTAGASAKGHVCITSEYIV